MKWPSVYNAVYTADKKEIYKLLKQCKNLDWGLIGIEK